MAVTAQEVKALRDRTGAGMMECKAALVEAGGDMDAAVDILRKRGLAHAAKKAGRSTADGLVGCFISADNRAGALVEVNCESDFVARTDDFKALADAIAADVVNAGDGVTDAILADPSGPVAPRIATAIAKLGENMVASRFVRFAGAGYVGSYVHLGGKIGVLVEFAPVSSEVAARDEFRTLVKEIAMQVAAASPQFVRREDVPADLLERERAVYRGQLEGSNKPPQVVEKIIEGKLGSFYEQVVLPDQPSIRDPKTTVAQMVADASKALGTEARITRFARVRLGESA